MSSANRRVSQSDDTVELVRMGLPRRGAATSSNKPKKAFSITFRPHSHSKLSKEHVPSPLLLSLSRKMQEHWLSRQWHSARICRGMHLMPCVDAILSHPALDSQVQAIQSGAPWTITADSRGGLSATGKIWIEQISSYMSRKVVQHVNKM